MRCSKLGCLSTCTATHADRTTVTTCEGYHSGPRHYAEFFGNVYSWEAGAVTYQVWPLFGSDWQDIAVTEEVLGG